MRTTIDIPDALFREIKSKAVQRGETLKTFLLRAATAELKAETLSVQVKKASLPIVKSKESSYKLSPNRIAELLQEEDLEALAGH